MSCDLLTPRLLSVITDRKSQSGGSSSEPDGPWLRSHSCASSWSGAETHPLIIWTGGGAGPELGLRSAVLTSEQSCWGGPRLQTVQRNDFIYTPVTLCVCAPVTAEACCRCPLGSLQVYTSFTLHNSTQALMLGRLFNPTMLTRNPWKLRIALYTFIITFNHSSVRRSTWIYSSQILNFDNDPVMNYVVRSFQHFLSSDVTSNTWFHLSNWIISQQDS